MANEVMLTTIDNPYNPFEQFDLWLLFDKEKGYNTCEYLARIVNLTNDMSEKEIEVATDRAIDDIIINDPFGIYKKVTSEDIIKVEEPEEPTGT